MSLKSEAFGVLRENLIAFDPSYRGKECVLCPVCLREVSGDEAERGGIEHIIPQAATRQDSAVRRGRATLNQRSGITLLCRQQRRRESDGKVYKHGCNGMKGAVYDWAFRNLLDDRPHLRVELAHRHGVAILTMAYLAAFQFFGYEYILRPALDDIRRQFDHPNERKTDYLDYAQYDLQGDRLPQPLVTESGQPFLWGSLMSQDAKLHLIFKRCRAALPGGHWHVNHAVRHLVDLLPG